MSSMRTPLARARGHGSAKEGASHFIGQRASAAMMLILVPWFLASLMGVVSSEYGSARAWFGSPVNAAVFLLAVGAGLSHMRLGLQTIVEDYIARPLARHILLLVNTFAACILFLAALVSVIRL